MMSGSKVDPHEDGGIITGGPALQDASGAIILLHGRGGSAAEMIKLGGEIGLRGLAMLAPQAVNHTWYPESFLAPPAMNEPWLTSAMKRIDRLLELCGDFAIPTQRVVIVGFSQGACLATEYVARNPRRYCAIIGLTGALFGPIGSDLFHPGSLESTPVLLTSGDPDPYIPWSRVEETAQQFRLMNASVDLRRMEGRSHTVSSEELDAGQQLLCSAFQR